MRFGISATSLMCPKNLRTRLRPVNVCCAIVASHFRRPCGRTFRSATAIAPGVNFETLERNKAQFQELSPESVLQTFKTQNDARAHDCTRPSQLAASRTEKARNLTVSQRLTPGTCRPHRLPHFPAAAPIWGGIVEIRGANPANPHTFLCSTL